MAKNIFKKRFNEDYAKLPISFWTLDFSSWTSFGWTPLISLISSFFIFCIFLHEFEMTNHFQGWQKIPWAFLWIFRIIPKQDELVGLTCLHFFLLFREF
jgi:hypothetical protein